MTKTPNTHDKAARRFLLVQVAAPLSRADLALDDLKRLEDVVARGHRGLARIREDRIRAA